MRLAVAGGTGVVGRYVVQAAMAAGHEVVTLSRHTGVDVRTGDGLLAALHDVDVIVDTTNAGTTNGAKATAFFTEVAHHLHAAGAGEGVAHLVVLSIVGLERVPGYGYYEAKLAHEAAALAGPLPTTIVRATQFHEFPAQVLSWTRHGPFAVVPRMRIKPVAARSVGQVLLEAAVARPPERWARWELAGPEEEDLVPLARTVVRHRGERVLVLPFSPPGQAGRAMRSGAQLPTPDVRIVGPSFSEWIEGEDVESVAG